MEKSKEFVEESLLRAPIARAAAELYDCVLELRDVVPRRLQNHMWKDMYHKTGFIQHMVLMALNSKVQKEKKRSLEKANEQLTTLRTLVHSLHRRRILSATRYQKNRELMLELGRMMGGFIRSIRG